LAGVRVLTSIDRAEIEQLRARGEFFWLDLQEPKDEDVEALGELFGLHPLVREDMLQFGQRPKLDDYEQYVFVVFYGARRFEERDLIEVHLAISGDYVLTIRRDDCDPIISLRKELARDPRTNEQFIVYRIFDVLTDSLFPLLAAIDDEIDELEDAIARQPTDEELSQIFALKRKLVALRRVVTPQRDLFASAITQVGRLPGLEAATRDYFRDVYDHLIRISDLIDSYRDLLSGAMDVYLSTVSNRLNAIMKQLTIVATVFLPLTVVTGFFGQNFKWMTDRIDTFAAFMVFGIGGLVGAVLVLLVWFRRSGFL
jgi:magnesium transporter